MVVKKFVCLGILLLALLRAYPVQAQVWDSHDYAPFTNFMDYRYVGEGSEFAGRVVNLEYGVNSQGYYQFRSDNTGAQLVHIYRLADEGIYEEAHFVEPARGDLRKDPDARDELRSLILPRRLEVGLTFKSGYQDEITLQVSKIIKQFDFMGTKYHDVIVIEDITHLPDSKLSYYYAPGYGLIYEHYQADGGDFQVHTRLEAVQGMSEGFRDKMVQ